MVNKIISPDNLRIFSMETYITIYKVVYGCDSWTRKKLKAKELMLLNSGVEEDS